MKLIKQERALYARIRELIIAARQTVSRGVDLVQVHTNFEIGRHIVLFEQRGKGRAAYGKEVVKNLAEKLAGEFGNGFSKSNLEYMRRFYLAYEDRWVQIAQTASGQLSASRKTQTVSGKSVVKPPSFSLSWSHYVVLLGIKNLEERRFYEIEATGQNWAFRELKRQYNSGLYERLALSRDKAGVRKLARKGQLVEKPTDILKEPLVLEFLGLNEQTRYSESDLETAIINQLERFLLELGKGFLFEARQKRFTFDTDHFFVDLVFYNRLLRCYVLIDLKIDKLTHQDLGQIQMYVNYFDRFVKTKDENATVGIVLCKERNEALVKITLPKRANIHAKEYQLYLPGKDELKQKLIEWIKECDG